MAGKAAKRKKAPFTLCRDYLGFGVTSITAGLGFFMLTLLTTANFVKILVIAFFMILGVIDLTLYYFFRER